MQNFTKLTNTLTQSTKIGKVRLMLALGVILILTILGLGCMNHRLIVKPDFMIQTRPQKLPKMLDGSPKICLECNSINGQVMYKFTEQDFLSDKKKHIEKDDYIDYLLNLLQIKTGGK